MGDGESQSFGLTTHQEPIPTDSEPDSADGGQPTFTINSQLAPPSRSGVRRISAREESEIIDAEIVTRHEVVVDNFCKDMLRWVLSEALNALDEGLK